MSTDPTGNFAPNSRYYGLETKELEVGGQKVRYLARRFIPHPEGLAVIGLHTVSQSERPDHVAAHYLNDPELFWRIADANRVLRPEELTETVGRRLKITLPPGMTGVDFA